MPLVSIDEFLNERKDFVKSGDVLMKAASKAPSSWNPDTRSVKFTMSAEVEDRDRDIVVQAGIETDEFMKNPIAPWAHRSRDFPIGTWSELAKITGRPKRTEGVLTVVPEGTDEIADQVARHLAAGSIRACSIGFIPKSVERREVPEDRRDSYFWPGYMIHECELVECSPCSIPSNPAALAKAAADGDVHAREMIEEILDNWAKDPTSGLLVPRSEFEAAYKVSAVEKTVVVVSKPAEEPAPEGLLDQVKALIAKAIGKGAEPVNEPEPPVLADPAAVEAAKARFEALTQRVAANTATT